MKKQIQIIRELESLKLEFDLWRRVRTKKCLTVELWDKAAGMARKYGVSVVSKTLKLSFSELRIRVKKTDPSAPLMPVRRVGTSPLAHPQFVELPGLSILERDRKKSGVQVRVHLGPDKQVELNWESPEAKDWENLFSGLLRAEGPKRVEALS